MATGAMNTAGGNQTLYRDLANVSGPEDLLFRNAYTKEIVSIREIRIAALVFQGRSDLLFHGYDGVCFPWCFSEPVTLLDLAIVFGKIELSMLLAGHGLRMNVPQCIQQVRRNYGNHVRYVRSTWMNDDTGDEPPEPKLIPSPSTQALVAALATGWFAGELEAVCQERRGCLRDWLLGAAVKLGEVKLVSDMLAFGVPKVHHFLDSFRRPFAHVGHVDIHVGSARFWMQQPQILEAAASATQNLNHIPFCIQLEPSGWRQAVSVLEFAILGGFAEAASVLSKADPFLQCMMDHEDFLWAISESSRMTYGVEMENFTMRVENSFEAASFVVDRRIRSAGSKYGIVLLQTLGKRHSLVHNILRCVAHGPSMLFQLIEAGLHKAQRGMEELDIVANFPHMMPGDHHTNGIHDAIVSARQASNPWPDVDSGQKVVDQRENEELLSAIQLSKADTPVLSGDNVVLLRLTRMARSPDVTSILLESPILAHCRNRVMEAGCEITPPWCCARFLVPCTETQVAKLEEAGFELLDHHIVALREDKDIIFQALKAMPKKKRPGVTAEHGNTGQIIPKSGRDATDVEETADHMDPLIVEEHSFSTDSSLFFPVIGSSFDAAHN